MPRRKRIDLYLFHKEALTNIIRHSGATAATTRLVKKEIADRLGITYPTVDSHVQRIYEKLQVHNAPAAINIAHRLGIFPPEP